ncbi:MAG: TIGR03943 family putative permease subunit [Acidimicrobiales bacterium]
MSAFAGSAITILVGLAAIGAAWTGTYANYVKVGLRWPLVVSGLILIGAGAVSMVIAAKRQPGGHQHRNQGIGALLVVFVAALALAPPPLGAAAAADRVPNRVSISEAPNSLDQRASNELAASATGVEPNTSETIVVDADPAPLEPALEDGGSDLEEVSSVLDTGASELTPTEPGAEGYAISLYDLIAYSYFAPDDIIGVPLQLVGFAVPEPELPGGFRLTRYLMGCCAADAFPLQVALVDAPFVPDSDQWVVVEAVWDGELIDVDEFGDGVPVLKVLSLTPTDPPPDPYES